MTEITLSKGKVALIDDEDLELVSARSWNFDRYARANVWNKELKKYEVKYMHRVIANAPKGMDVDHINGDKLDNRRANLRVCTRSENLHNLKKKSRSDSGLRGAYREKNRGENCRWFSQMSVRGKMYHLGRFDTAEEAHEAYKKAHKEHYPHIAQHRVD